MMCIDGVVDGYYRCSRIGDDLNRVWHAPDPARHPVVYHTKALMRDISSRRPIGVYIDFHGHSCQHGTFAFGCPTDGDHGLEHSPKLFPRLLSMLIHGFSWAKCVFSFPDERKTASRIVVRKEIGVVQAFTIETSFGGADGALYDEVAWREIGRKVAEGLYHVSDGASSLRACAQCELENQAKKEGMDSWHAQCRARAEAGVKKQASMLRKSIGTRVTRPKIVL
jgi:hypothetical protein